MLPVNGDGGHDHDRQEDGGADRTEQAERDQQAADHFADRGRGRKETSRLEAKPFEETARSGKAVATEPSEQLLGSVTGHEDAENDARDE